MSRKGLLHRKALEAEGEAEAGVGAPAEFKDVSSQFVGCRGEGFQQQPIQGEMPTAEVHQTHSADGSIGGTPSQ